MIHLFITNYRGHNYLARCHSFLCSAATLKSIDSAGLGMVRDGTKCDTNKVTEYFPRKMTYGTH